MPRALSSRFAFFVWIVALLAVGGLIAFSPSKAAPPRSTLLSGGGAPVLSSGFSDWKLCTSESKVESHPSYFWLTKWGCATIEGATGCGCGGNAQFSGNPFTAGTGFAIAPPHDFQSDAGQLPPSGRDHPFVLAATGEVVYTETDFVIPGIGFDLNFTRTYRSAYEFDGEFANGWDYSAQLFLIENNAGDTVTAFLGDGRVEDQYTWNSGNSKWDSPSGFFDELTEGTRGGGHPDFPNLNYFIKTEKNGIVWEFDLVNDAIKDWYACTKISDLYGNEMVFRYDDGSDPTLLTKITDTEGREVTFTRSGGYITQVTVSSSAVGDYGALTIDYSYTGDNLTQVTKHYTRTEDGGTKVRPYTEYTYLSSGIFDEDLDLVKDCGTTVLDFDYSTYDSTIDRCTQVTDADGDDYDYAHDQ